MERVYINKLCLAFISMWLLASVNVYAQEGHLREHDRAQHNNFYHKVELNYGNIYSFALTSCLTGLINYLVDDAIFETGFGVPIYREQTGPQYSFARQNLLGVQPRDLIHNFDCALKLGYQTYDPQFFNIGICAIAAYKYEPFCGVFLQDDETVTFPSSIKRALFGGNLLLFLGEMGMSTRVTLEAGLRYSYGIAFNDSSSLTNKSALNNGLVSHYAVSIGGPGFFQNIKLFADITHFSLIESPNLRLSPIYLGFSWTVTPQQSFNKR